jgi:hypothetical protein
VSYLPLRAITTRRGATIRAGTPLGVVAPGHGGLHVGVRREGDPFAYEDPLALLPAPGTPSAPVAAPRLRHLPPRRTAPVLRHAPPPRTAPVPPHAPRPAPARRSRPARSTRPAPRSAPRTTTAPRSAPTLRPAPAKAPGGLPTASAGPAPWPVWLGLALLLCGAAGSGTIAVRRRRRAAPPSLATLESLR